MKRLKKFWLKIRGLLLITWYTLFYYRPKVKESWILIDSKTGKDLASNMLRIAEELMHNQEYRGYKVYISCNKDKKDEVKKMMQTYQLQGAKLIKYNGFCYARIMASAKYLFLDTSFPAWFAKKKNQVITNTWHGTPLKMMGKDVGNRAFDMGNVQKNHLLADYLIYPSDYMCECMTSAYFLDNLYQGKILHSGYPRNSVFFDRERRKNLREKLGLEGKRLYGYMPTWRGVLKKMDSTKITNQLEYYFMQLDDQLKDDEIFFVRLHPFVANNIDYSAYRHIQTFPEGYEPYDILNICDCMVTDYSSVMFDYANSGNKIILFVYDREFYMDERGVYVSIDTFPFPQVRSVKNLLAELRTPKQYDDTEFRKKFCQYDGEKVAEKLCCHIVKGEKIYEEFTTKQNGKENVLIYSGSLAKNGLTTALMSLLANADKEKRNYFITFRSASLKKFPERVSLIPKDVGFIPIHNMTNFSFGERNAIGRYFEKNKTHLCVVRKVDRFFERLYERNYGGCKFDYVIQYAGYEKEIINMFLRADAKRIIFVHNDMVEEMKTRGNQHELTLKRAYHDYDKVVPVTTDIYESTLKIGKNKENIQIVNNCHDYKSVIEKSKKELCFDADTLCNVQIDELNQILDSGAQKFITIGRFSPEKGHSMLLKAFDKYYKENPNSYLIIIGGHGILYEQTLGQAQGLASSSHIVIIRSISNPMPILKKCDLFVLSSLYEGLGLVLLEADTLGVPVISTDIVGPRGFLTEHGGYMVEPNVKGLYNGMKAYNQGKVKAMNVDYEAYNRNSVAQFEKLFEGEA